MNCLINLETHLLKNWYKRAQRLQNLG